MTTTAAFGWGSSHLTATPAGEVDLGPAGQRAVQRTIRGHAEPARPHPDPAPPGVSRALERITAESSRMGGMVDDLLLLASLGPGRPPAREPVDPTRPILDAVDDARAAAPEDLRGTLFERFARTRHTRTGPQGHGAGLGLAIVSAVATTYGGTTQVSSRPGATTFTVSLTGRRPAPPDDPVPPSGSRAGTTGQWSADLS